MPRDESYLLYMLISARRVVESTASVTWDDFAAKREK